MRYHKIKVWIVWTYSEKLSSENTKKWHAWNIERHLNTCRISKIVAYPQQFCRRNDAPCSLHCSDRNSTSRTWYLDNVLLYNAQRNPQIQRSKTQLFRKLKFSICLSALHGNGNPRKGQYCNIRSVQRERETHSSVLDLVQLTFPTLPVIHTSTLMSWQPWVKKFDTFL